MASYPPFQEDITAQAGQVNNPAWRQFFVRLGTLLAGTASNVSTYILASADATLLNSRVLTGSVSNTVNNSTPGQVTIERAALTGDVTANANANATTIAANAVTYAKMQDVSAASRLIGRGSAAGAGDPQEITLSGLSMVGTVLTGTGGSVTNTGTLAANQLIIGNGGVDVTALGTLGTTTTVLHGDAAGAPTFGAVNLVSDVTGTLSVSNGGTGLATLAASRVPYGDGTNALQSAADFTFDGTTFTTAGQIAFPATQLPSAGANVLDDYEEGDWTPTLAFGGGSTGLTYSSNVGKYVKIGRQVVITGLLALSAKGSSTGAAVVSGLPFSIGGAAFGFYSSNKVSYSAFTAGVQEVGLQTVLSSATMIPVKSVAGTNTQLTDVDFTNTSQMVMYLVYFVS